MQEDPRRILRHDLRGKWHALRLCLSALELSETRDEKTEMLDLLVSTAGELEAVIDRILALPEP